MIRRNFLSGFFSGVIAVLLVLTGAVAGAYLYFNDSANNAAVYVTSSSYKDTGTNQVELYFPLEKFLSWRSTSDLQLQLVQDQVRVRLYRQPFASLPIKLTIDIMGTPTVWHGFFMLTKVAGYVNHIPIPSALLFSAIAAEGGRYGVRVNEARDTIFIDKTFNSYHLLGYDAGTKDLIIAMPVSTVLKAAKDQTAI